MKKVNLSLSEKKDLIIILLGIILILGYFLATKVLVQKYLGIIPEEYEYLQLLYWGGYILILFPLIVLFNKSTIRLKWLSVFFFVSCLLFAYPLLSSYGHIYNHDVFYSYQVAEIYHENGFISTEGATGQALQYINYPGLPLVHLICSILMGIKLEWVYLFLIPLVRLFTVPFLIYLILQKYFLALFDIFYLESTLKIFLS